MVRNRLYEATLSAVRFNLAVKGIYQQLEERGKPEKVARIAVARKLLPIVMSRTDQRGGLTFDTVFAPLPPHSEMAKIWSIGGLEDDPVEDHSQGGEERGFFQYP